MSKAPYRWKPVRPVLPDGTLGEWQADCEARLRIMAKAAGIACPTANTTLATLATIRHDGQRTPLPPVKRVLRAVNRRPHRKPQPHKRQLTDEEQAKALLASCGYVPGKLGYHCR